MRAPLILALALLASAGLGTAVGTTAHAQEQETPPVKVGAWTYRTLLGDNGLGRYAFTREKNHGESILSVTQSADEPCDTTKDGDEILLAFSSERQESYFKIEGEADPEQSRTLKAAVAFARAGKYDEPAKGVTLELQDLDGQFYVSVNAKTALSRSHLALCPADPRGRPGSDCHEFSLEGFARAYRFVCTGK